MRPLLLLTAITLLTSPATADEQVDLEVTRVAVFNSGVAYYECEADVEGDALAELNFRTEQVNDILKSLMVQDLGGGTIGVVRYASQDPIEKTLKSFGVDITGNPSLGELLDQLRGQRVEISGGQSLSGLIVGVEQHTTKLTDDTVVKQDRLNVLTEQGIRQLPLTELGGIRLADPKVADELQKALATLAMSNDASKKSVQLRFEGSGKRRVRVAYLLEAPIWKTSYRLALDEEGKPFLQGWATVENATEKDWNDVRLSLVSGRPISFRMDLYSPIYIPRPLEELELYASLRPPQYEGAVLGTPLQTLARGSVDRKAAPAPEARLRAAGRVNISAEHPEGYFSDYDGGVDLSEMQSVADAADAGELFQYTIQSPVSLPRQRSAMLPIVNQMITGSKVSIYNPATHHKHPLNGLEITNNTELNLMQGPVTLFDGDVYAGDAKLPDLQPNEKRLIAYALDLSTEVTVKQAPRPSRMTDVRLVKGALIRTDKYVDEREYLVKNKSDRTRTVLLEQPYDDSWKLVEPDKPYERTASLSRFKLDVKAGETGSQTVKLERIMDQTVSLTNLATDRILFYVRSRIVPQNIKDALQKVIEFKNGLVRAQQQRTAAETKYQEAVQEQKRVRDNLKTLTRDSDAHRRQMEKFDRLETEIENARDEIKRLRDAEKAAKAELDRYLLGLTME